MVRRGHERRREDGEDEVFPRAPRYTQVRDQVLDTLRDAIVELRLKPGERLREAELSERLGVSKTPIREALIRLEELGLVTTENYKGALVRGYTPEDLVEIYELRELLQGACAGFAARGHISGEGLEELRRVVERSEDAHRRGDEDAAARAFDEFDEIVMAQTSNRRIASLLEGLRDHMVRIGLLSAAIPGRIDVSLREHRGILEAIEAGDPAEAEERMRAHVRSVLDDHLASAAEVDALAEAPPDDRPERSPLAADETEGANDA